MGKNKICPGHSPKKSALIKKQDSRLIKTEVLFYYVSPQVVRYLKPCSAANQSCSCIRADKRELLRQCLRNWQEPQFGRRCLVNSVEVVSTTTADASPGRLPPQGRA